MDNMVDSRMACLCHSVVAFVRRISEVRTDWSAWKKSCHPYCVVLFFPNTEVHYSVSTAVVCVRHSSPFPVVCWASTPSNCLVLYCCHVLRTVPSLL